MHIDSLPVSAHNSCNLWDCLNVTIDVHQSKKTSYTDIQDLQLLFFMYLRIVCAICGMVQVRSVKYNTASID